MMAGAGASLGLSFRAADPSADSCSRQVCELSVGDFSDLSFLGRFCAGLDAATYEWENVPVSAAAEVASHVPVFFPPVAALEMAQDRLIQKEYLVNLGLPTAPFVSVDSKLELIAAIDKLALPAVLKTRRHGYDGKGQFILRTADDVDRAWSMLGNAPLILEGFVPFLRELSIVAVRSRDGAMAFYPLAQNEHRDGILHVSIAPAPECEQFNHQSVAENYARTILENLNYVGTLTIELFEHNHRLLINEVATRVHNSGHWTMDGAHTSQFENHLRAGLGLPLGSTKLIAPTAMVNIIGTVPNLKDITKAPSARVHLYGKSPKPGRKLGHINVLLSELPIVLDLLKNP
jgi:5-(carboxyamino)imidazole ribonucleotide synthase